MYVLAGRGEGERESGEEGELSRFFASRSGKLYLFVGSGMGVGAGEPPHCCRRVRNERKQSGH